MEKQKKIYIKIVSFHHGDLDRATEGVLRAFKGLVTLGKGPIPLPNSYRRYIFNRSPHVNKKSREKFCIKRSSRLLVIDSLSADAIKSLNNFNLGAGVDVVIKVK